MDEEFPISPAVVAGDTADVYFLRTREVLEKAGLNPRATMEVFPARDGLLCGMREVVSLLRTALPEGSEVWGLPEGQSFVRKEVVLRITAPYQSYGIYETAIVGYLAQESGWATAARECVEAAQGVPVISFGARHVHPDVAAVMDYAAVVGGCLSCSSVLGARLAGIEPAGTMPHALIICFGDTVDAALAFDKFLPPEVPRTVLVDTFHDEAEEAVRVASVMGERIRGVRLDTPGERGGVTAELVKEVRARLDQGGYGHVEIFVSGGVTPQRMREMREIGARVDGFGVGSYITSAPPIDFTADLKEVEGKPIAKRGRIPGITPNPRLIRLI
ncbi:MAG: nicotinate phosphoribosyltransferase [Dehalococcoidia bacterium]|nr:nicotinate phosphoribosyltransferase [Dehalococcoidia bacterium]